MTENCVQFDKNELIKLFKSKIDVLRKEINQLEFEANAKDEQIIEERTLRAELDKELESLTRKAGLLENQLVETEKKLQESKTKLEEMSSTAEESERARKQLQLKHDFDDDSIYQLELRVKEVSDQATEAENRYEEVSRKLVAAESLLEETESECEKYEKNFKQLQSEMNTLCSSLKIQEKNEMVAAELEKKYEVELKALKSKLQAAEKRAEEAENLLIEKQAVYNKLEDDLEAEKRKHHLLQSDMQRIVDEFQHM